MKELDGGNHASVKVGTATTNLQMLNWSNKSGWTLPADIIAVMITYGGSNATLCHGSGLATQTLSDLVLEMELVDANGEQKVFYQFFYVVTLSDIGSLPILGNKREGPAKGICWLLWFGRNSHFNYLQDGQNDLGKISPKEDKNGKLNSKARWRHKFRSKL